MPHPSTNTPSLNSTGTWDRSVCQKVANLLSRKSQTITSFPKNVPVWNMHLRCVPWSENYVGVHKEYCECTAGNIILNHFFKYCGQNSPNQPCQWKDGVSTSTCATGISPPLLLLPVSWNWLGVENPQNSTQRVLEGLSRGWGIIACTDRTFGRGRNPCSTLTSTWYFNISVTHPETLWWRVSYKPPPPTTTISEEVFTLK